MAPTTSLSALYVLTSVINFQCHMMATIHNEGINYLPVLPSVVLDIYLPCFITSLTMHK
jgi:hypothetical protein